MQLVTKETLRIYLQHVAKHKWAFISFYITIAIIVTIEMYRPVVASKFIDSLYAGENGSYEASMHWVYLLVGMTALIQGLWRVTSYLNNYCQPLVMTDLLNTSYAHVIGQSFKFFSNSFVGSLVSKIRRFAASFETIDDVLKWEVVKCCAFIIVLNVYMTRQRASLGLIVLAWSVLYTSVASFMAKKIMKYDALTAEQESRVSAHSADTLTNHVNIKVFNSKKREIERHNALTAELTRLRQKAWNLSTHAQIFQSASMVVLEAIVLHYLVKSVFSQKIVPSEAIMIQGYIALLFNYLWNFGTNIRKIFQSLGNANEGTELLLEQHEIVDKPGAKELVVTDGKIEFRDIWFSYANGRKVFKGFNLTVHPGEKLGLVGLSGQGKTTLFCLLLRFAELDAGQILIDGQDITTVTLDSLYHAIGYVQQDPSLFHRSVTGNLGYADPEATIEQIEQAAIASHCHEFVTKLGDGYKTLVGERGVKLSGGERQRIAIGRALVKNPRVLLLDEATSALDSESEDLVQQALYHLIKGRTTMVIAHRLATIQRLDRIVVIFDGTVLEEGTHDQLMKTDGTYRMLWQKQANSFAASS